MTAPQLESSSKCPIAMFNDIRRLRDGLAACKELEFVDLTDVPDDLLREVTNILCEIRELVGNLYEPVAFQIEDNEMAELEAEQIDMADECVPSTLPVCEAIENTGGLEFDEQPTNSEGFSNRQRAAGLLADAYASMFRRIRNRDRESPSKTEYREQQFEAFDSLVKSMGDEDQAYFSRLEDTHMAQARRIHEKVAARLKFWGLPETTSPDRHRRQHL